MIELQSKFNPPKDDFNALYEYNPKDALDHFATILGTGNDLAEYNAIVACLREDNCPSAYMQLSSGLTHMWNVLQLLDKGGISYILSNVEKGEFSLIGRMARSVMPVSSVVDVFQSFTEATRIDLLSRNRNFVLDVASRMKHANQSDGEILFMLDELVAGMSYREKEALVSTQNLDYIKSMIDESPVRQRISRILAIQPCEPGEFIYCSPT